MNSIDEAILQIETLQKVLKRSKSIQIKNVDDKSTIKASALSWFQNIRGKLPLVESQLKEIDDNYKSLLEAAEKNTTKTKYLVELKNLRSALIKLRSDNIVSISNQSTQSPDVPPDFSVLIKDEKMKVILLKRWAECLKCIAVDAPLSSVVMMGGMLEAILLARINSFADKSKIFKAKCAPIDKKTTKVYPLQEWTLRNYIDVAHELNWISQSAKDIGEVLRDYRNYIHPYKELSHGIIIIKSDAELFWQITKSIINQILVIK
jgi:uncharacterized protein YhaN